MEQIIDQPPPYPIEEFTTASQAKPLIAAPSISVEVREASIEKIDMEEEEVVKKNEERPESNIYSETGSETEDSSSYSESDYSSSDAETEASKSKMYSDDDFERGEGNLGIGIEVGRSTEILNDGNVRVASNVRYQSSEASSIDQAQGIYL